MKTLRSYFVGTPRASQDEILDDIEDGLRNYDVTVVLAPVGAGKTKEGEAACRFMVGEGLAQSAVYTVRTNALLDQVRRSVGQGFHSLYRKAAYRCVVALDDPDPDNFFSCEDHHKKSGFLCRGCPYRHALIQSKKKPVRLLTNWSLQLAHRIRPDFVVIDEAHGVPAFLAELGAQTWWRKVWAWPRTIETVADIERWVAKNKSPDLDPIRETLAGMRPNETIKWGEAEYFGKPTDYIRVQPLDGSQVKSPLWGPNTKILLMSATLSWVDIEAMGLSRKRIKWVTQRSEISPDRRPLWWSPLVDMRAAARTGETPQVLTEAIESVLAHFAGKRGVIHATYEVARWIRERSQNPRLRFHSDAETKAKALQDFLKISGPDDDRVLVISGQMEGLDLAEDLARFQIMTAWPRESLGDPAIRRLAETRPEVYRWHSIRDGAQGYGRVCRGPNDEGVTVLLDASAGPELQDEQAPAWLREAIVKC